MTIFSDARSISPGVEETGAGTSVFQLLGLLKGGLL